MSSIADVAALKEESGDPVRNLGVGLDDLVWYEHRYGSDVTPDISQEADNIRSQRAAMMKDVWRIRQKIADAIKGGVGLR